jgi:hypothetical protein
VDGRDPGRVDAGHRLGNDEIADRLDEIAELLAAQDANPFRVRAYHVASQRLRSLDEPVAAILEREGTEGLERLPGIGPSLARTIEQLALTGRLGLLERLRGGGRVEQVFASVPGIGPELARRVHDELGIETLADLELAAHDGRLETVAGFGERRVRGVRESLAGRFRRGPDLPESRRMRRPPDEVPPPIAEILDVDREYRERAHHGTLPRIAPRRFNPTAAAWLPVLHTQRGNRHYTALFSNTARAHELGTTHDWVVVYRDDHDGHGQWTVVTARFGPRSGERVVRGYESVEA